MTMTPPEAEDFDVVIIGAGFSGLGAAYRISERNPGTSYVILERREQLGGTWDLFRYPGVRSDSSIFTLCFPWEPWAGEERVADGVDISRPPRASTASTGTSASTPTSGRRTGTRRPTPGPSPLPATATT